MGKTKTKHKIIHTQHKSMTTDVDYVKEKQMKKKLFLFVEGKE